jgi:hypothetical protein
MLSVNEINRFIDEKRREKHGAYEHVFALCQKQIINYAKMEKLRCFFDVPEFILGIPMYDLNAVILYIIDKLQHHGYLVKYFFPKYIYICWDKDEIAGRSPKPREIPQQQIQYQQQAPPSKLLQYATSTRHNSYQPTPQQNNTASAPLLITQNMSQAPVTANHTGPLSTIHKNPLFPPPPVATRVVATNDQSSVMADEPMLLEANQQSSFVKSIRDFKPSGKFVLDLD